MRNCRKSYCTTTCERNSAEPHAKTSRMTKNKWKCLPVNCTVTNSTPNEVGQKAHGSQPRSLRCVLKEARSLVGHHGVGVSTSRTTQWRKYFISLLSLSGTPQVRECVATTASLIQYEMEMSAVKCATQMPWRVHWRCVWFFPVGQQVFLCLRSLAFKVLCFLSRPACFDTNRLMSCTAVTDFPEGTACLFDCRFLRGPTVGELPGSGGQVFA